MTYTILSTTQLEDTITTTVQLTINSYNTIVDIAHFRPASQEEIYNNILNRIKSEQYKLDAVINCILILPLIKLNEEITI